MSRKRFHFDIRPARPADFEAVTALFAGPKAVAGTLQLPLTSPEVWRQRLAEPEPGLTFLVACHKGEIIGCLGLHGEGSKPRRRHAARLGMTVRDDWQGRGAGTALMRAALDLADNWMNLVRLELSVFTDNAPAVQLYRNFGFEVEGTQRAYAFRAGRFVDAYLMSRIRPAPTA